MHIICPELKKTHWKEQYEGTEFPLPSEAQIERHANLINSPSACPPASSARMGALKARNESRASWISRALSRELFQEVPRSWSASFNMGTAGSIFLNLETTGSNIFNFGTTGSDLISIWERQDQFFWIWNDRIKYGQFGNDRIRFNFNLGTTGSNILNLERQDQI